MFPQYRKNPFYLTGESYGGHYVPQLAARILQDKRFYSSLNMKGFWIGNPGLVSSFLTRDLVETKATVFTDYSGRRIVTGTTMSMSTRS